MADNSAAGEFFTRKIGGIPTWVYLGAAGVGAAGLVWYQNSKKGQSTASASSSGTSASNAASSLYPIAPVTYVTGIPSSSPQPTASSSSASSLPDTPVNASDWSSVPGYDGLMYSKGSFNQGGYTYFHLADPTASAQYQASGGQTYYFPEPGVAVPGAPTGSVQYGRVPESSALAGTGMGGHMVAGHAGGAGPWAQMNQRFHVPTYWSGMGGSGGGKGSSRHAGLQAAAKHAGIPAERVVHLNRNNGGGLIRIA